MKWLAQTVAIFLCAVPLAVIAADDSSSRYPYESSPSGTVDYASEFGFLIQAPTGNRFCWISSQDKRGYFFGREGFFVPLPRSKCEDFVDPDAPARVQVTLHHNTLDDEWEANREYCAKSEHDPDDAFLTEMRFSDLGRVAGVRAQRCVRAYAPNAQNAKGYYMNQVTLFRGPPDSIGGAHYVLRARGDIEYRAQLDAFLSEVLKGVHISSMPKGDAK